VTVINLAQLFAVTRFKLEKWQVSDPVANNARENNVHTANLLIIVVTILVLGGSARYIRGHWF
jgi:hypothetical protein